MEHKLKCLNVGCGKKYHKDWYNVDMVADSKYVIAANLIKGIPFPDNTFDVVYHSQVLEHIPKHTASFFINECYRVLKKGGILRVVLPDLENIAKEYLRFLNENLENPTEVSQANYDWMMLELYDQAVRHSSGGYMIEYLENKNMVNEQFILNRIGYVGWQGRNGLLKKASFKDNILKALGSFDKLKKGMNVVLSKIVQKLNFSPAKMQVGQFRLGGEVHMWMYDRYSLSKLLLRSGFSKTSVKSPETSDIPDWAIYELDIKDGKAYDPTSLFMEAIK